MAYNKNPGYIDNLLAVRGLSSLGVMVVHSLGISAQHLGLLISTADVFQKYLKYIWPTTAGNFVFFFFVHSGYLMGKVFFQGRYHLDYTGVRRFYKNRILRIVPLFYFNLIVCAALMPIWLSPRKVVGDILFINNYTGIGINPVSWSLSWEMQYYFLAPLVALVFRRISLPTLFWAIATGVVLILIKDLAGLYGYQNYARFTGFFLAGFSVNLLLRLFKVAKKFPFSDTLAIIFGFFGGNIGFYYFDNLGQHNIADIVLGVCAIFTIYLLELPHKRKFSGKRNLLTSCDIFPDTGGKVAEDTPPHSESNNIDLRFTSYGTPKLLFLRFWTWLGILSYGIYLWHFVVLQAQQSKMAIFQNYMVNKLHMAGPLLFVGYNVVQILFVFTLTITLSFLTFVFIELRFRPNLYDMSTSRHVMHIVLSWMTPSAKKNVP